MAKSQLTNKRLCLSCKILQKNKIFVKREFDLVFTISRKNADLSTASL